MGSLNKVLLIGRLGQDPEKRVTPGGHSVVNFSLATTEYSKDQSGNKKERTEWHSVVAWNKQAELVEQYCHKGSQLFVEGSLQTRDWQDKDGNKRYTTEIVVRNMQFLDPKKEVTPASQYRVTPQNQFNSPGEAPANNDGSFDNFIEDDIPF